MSFLHAVILFCNFAPATCMPQILLHIILLPQVMPIKQLTWKHSMHDAIVAMGPLYIVCRARGYFSN